MLGIKIKNKKDNTSTLSGPLVSLTLSVAHPKIADTDRTRLPQEDGVMSKSLNSK